MITGKTLFPGTLLALAVFLGACSDSTPEVATVTAALQDLDADPNGFVTRVTFSRDVGSLTPAEFESSGGQSATSVTFNGTVATVVWGARVTPTDQIRVVERADVEDDFVAVTSSDTDPPSFVISAGTQTPGLGGDTFTVTFSGARVVPADVEDPSNWNLSIDGVSLDLAGSDLDFVVATQTLSVTLGAGANLHSEFQLAAAGVRSVSDVLVGPSNVSGTATGDVTAPTLLSAVQNLGYDFLGRTIDFTFDEAMDPVFATQLINFQATFPIFPMVVSQPAEGVLRVTFSTTVMPGVDSVTLDGVMDSHGNEAVGGAVAVAASGATANDFDGDPELLTVENAGGDYLTVTFSQAIHPPDAVDATRWYLEVDSVPVTLGDQVLSYDLLTRTLTIELDEDYLNGDSFEFGGALGNPPRDVDADDFTQSFTGVIGGDEGLPTVATVVQDRSTDSTGQTIEVSFSEDVDETEAENAANYTFDPAGLSITAAELLGNLDTVRLTLDGVAVPGDVQVAVAGVLDLAGNAMAASGNIDLDSTDINAPLPGTFSAEALEGLDNDQLIVAFSDEMVAAEVEDPANWSVESPSGVSLDTSNATITYDPNADRATLVFDGGDGINLQRDALARVTLDTMRDIAGNEIFALPLTATIQGEERFPTVESVWVETANTDTVHVRFDEPTTLLEDVYDAGTNPTGLTVYEMFDNVGALKGLPTSVVASPGGREVVLTFAFSVLAGSDTLDVRGATDLAGNQMLPVEDLAVEVEDPAEVALDTGVSVLDAIEAENNDVITVALDRPASSWTLTDPAHYSLTGPTTIDLTSARFEVLAPDTVQITLTSGAGDLEFNGNYTLEIDGLESAQGVPMSSASSEAILVTSDNTGPTLSAARIDAQDASSLIVELSEALNATDAEDESLYDILAANPTTATRLGPRSLRLTFAVAPTPGDTLNLTGVRDLAGNAGTVSLAVTAAATDGPLLAAVSGTVVPGTGGDFVRVEFDEPVTSGTGLNSSYYTVTNGATVVDLTGASLRFDSSGPAVDIYLADGVNLQPADALTVDVTDVSNHDGFPMDPAGSLGGSVTGDSTAPTAGTSFVNYRKDISRRVLDLTFSEAIDPAAMLDTANYASSGGHVINSATRLSDRAVRLTLSGTFNSGELITATGLSDLAGNAAGALLISPVFWD